MAYALLFPGQGSQSLGMLEALAVAHPQVGHTFDEASTVLGLDLGRLIREGPKDQLDRTENTQPALLAAGIAVWRVWQTQGAPPPQALAGHSLGEYSALVAAGALDFADALRLVRLRGQLMQAAVPEGQGGMAAVIGLDDEPVEALCRAYAGPGLLAPANYNAPGQVVVAGDAAALDWLIANGKAQGARMVMRVGMSVPSHCALLRKAAEKLHEQLLTISIRTPSIPVLHNLDAAPRHEAAAIRIALREQLHQPVRWTATQRALHAQGINTYLECGPGKVLCGLVKRTLDGARFSALEDPAGQLAALALVKD